MMQKSEPELFTWPFNLARNLRYLNTAPDLIALLIQSSCLYAVSVAQVYYLARLLMPAGIIHKLSNIFNF